MFTFIPPTGLTLVLGKAGAGKTSFASMLVSYANKNHIRVLTNVPILGAEVFKAKEQLGVYDLSHCMLIVDESGSEFSGRRWQTNFNDEMLDYIVRFRHAHIDYFVFISQNLNMDKAIRDLCNTLLILYKAPFGFTSIDEFNAFIGTDDEGNLITKWIQSNRFPHLFYRPKYYNMFDSYEIKELPPLPSNPWNSINRFRSLEEIKTERLLTRAKSLDFINT